MTFTNYNIALPIALGVLFGLFRFMERRTARVPDALGLSVKDAITGMLGMAMLTVVLKYLAIL